MTCNVTLEGNFVTELKVEAADFKEAEKKAKEQLDKLICLPNEDYVIDLVTVGKE